MDVFSLRFRGDGVKDAIAIEEHGRHEAHVGGEAQSARREHKVSTTATLGVHRIIKEGGNVHFVFICCAPQAKQVSIDAMTLARLVHEVLVLIDSFAEGPGQRHIANLLVRGGPQELRHSGSAGSQRFRSPIVVLPHQGGLVGGSNPIYGKEVNVVF